MSSLKPLISVHFFFSVYKVALFYLQNAKKQRLAEAAVDSMKQQMLELCRSDTLSRSREQHDRDLAIIKEQHEAALLTVKQQLDSTSQALNDQVCIVTVTGFNNGTFN